MTVRFIYATDYRCGEVPVCVRIPARLSHTGKDRWATVLVDKCVADIVDALTKAGIYTDASCCAHGHGNGSIILADGRRLWVEFPDDWEAHKEPK